MPSSFDQQGAGCFSEKGGGGVFKKSLREGRGSSKVKIEFLKWGTYGSLKGNVCEGWFNSTGWARKTPAQL